MKAILIVVLVFGILIFGGIGSCFTIKQHIDEFLPYIDVVEKCVEEKDVQKLGYSLRIADEKWKETKKRLSLLTDHEYIFEVDLAICELYGFLKNFDDAEAMLSVTKAKAGLGCIKETNALTFENII